MSLILSQNITSMKTLDGASAPKLELGRGNVTRPEVRS